MQAFVNVAGTPRADLIGRLPAHLTRKRGRHPRGERNCVHPRGASSPGSALALSGASFGRLLLLDLISDFPKLSLTLDPNQLRIPRHPVPREGALAIVTDVGAGSGGRRCAFDEQRMTRTAKSCGPDAPMAGVKFARSSRFLRATVTSKPGLAGESTI